MRERLLCAAAVLVLCGLTPPALLTAAEPQAHSRKDVWIEPETGIEFVLIPGGEFVMGSDERHADEGPLHTVQVGSFYLGRYEVTQRQWARVTGNNPSHFAGCEDCPVEQVSWEDVQKFMKGATDLTGIGLRLPTEAEWEYAAGGGAVHQRWPGTDSEREPGEYAWYSGNFAGKSRPVGLKIPNLFRIYDMGGNVGEWCADRYGEDYYRKSPVLDPKGPEGGERRVVRGGSWLSSPYDTRSARRSGRSPATRSRTIGFRAAADLSPEGPAGFTAPRRR